MFTCEPLAVADLAGQISSSAPLVDVKPRGRRDVTWARTAASLNTGTTTSSGRSRSARAWDAKRSDVGVPTTGTIWATSRGGLKTRRGKGVAPCASSSRSSWTARWSERKARWKSLVSSVPRARSVAAAAGTRISSRPNWSKNSRKC